MANGTRSGRIFDYREQRTANRDRSQEVYYYDSNRVEQDWTDVERWEPNRGDDQHDADEPPIETYTPDDEEEEDESDQVSYGGAAVIPGLGPQTTPVDAGAVILAQAAQPRNDSAVGPRASNQSARVPNVENVARRQSYGAVNTRRGVPGARNLRTYGEAPMRLQNERDLRLYGDQETRRSVRNRGFNPYDRTGRMMRPGFDYQEDAYGSVRSDQRFPVAARQPGAYGRGRIQNERDLRIYGDQETRRQVRNNPQARTQAGARDRDYVRPDRQLRQRSQLYRYGNRNRQRAAGQYWDYGEWASRGAYRPAITYDPATNRYGPAATGNSRYSYQERSARRGGQAEARFQRGMQQRTRPLVDVLIEMPDGSRRWVTVDPRQKRLVRPSQAGR